MGCLGVLFALDQQEVEHLVLLRADPLELLEHVVEIIEEEKISTDDGCELDKAWDALRYCFALAPDLLGPEFSVLPLAILGGDSLHEPEHYIITLKSPEQTAQIAAALDLLTPESLSKCYEQIPAEYAGPHNRDDLEYTVSYFEDLREFFRIAAKRGKSVIFTVDQ